MTSLETVYAVHNFEAENNDELTFQIGEPIIIIQKDDGFNDGWWKVYIHPIMLYTYRDQSNAFIGTKYEWGNWYISHELHYI